MSAINYPNISGGPVGSLQSGTPPIGGPVGAIGLSGLSASQQAAKVPEKSDLEKGVECLSRMEPNIMPMDPNLALTSIAISLRDMNLNLRSIVNQIREGDIGQGQNLRDINQKLTDLKSSTDKIGQAAYKLVNAESTALESRLKQLRGY